MLSAQTGAIERHLGGAPVVVDAVFHVREVKPALQGPWSGEADKIAWTDAMTGYGCIIRRSPKGGHLCGYVSVPPTHPIFGRQVHSLCGYRIGVHGGLDYSAPCQHWEREDRSVCHVTAPVPDPRRTQAVHVNAEVDRHDDAWWFGFSCNHPGDIVPDAARLHGAEPLAGINDPTYKDERFVYSECLRLAAQLKILERGGHPSDVDPGPAASAYDPNGCRG